MRVEVTGFEGFVGRHLVRALRACGHEFVGIWEAPDLVIHAGARVGRERCDRDKKAAITLNVASTLELAEACAANGTSLLYISSAEADTPRNLYGLTKHWAEEACRLALPSEHLTIARLGAQYGPGARRGADTLTNFMQAAMEGKDLRVYRDTWRTWTYVEDTARALVLIAEAALNWREHGKHTAESALYNVDSGDQHMLFDVACAVADLVGRGEVLEVAAPAGYSDLPRVNTDRLRELGWEPQVAFAEGLTLTYAGLRESLLAVA